LDIDEDDLITVAKGKRLWCGIYVRHDAVPRRSLIKPRHRD
jgi:hypothetical protein